ncbi:MAG: hypothetical protein QOG15_1120 [Solirubrobacteraceae bacterium]|jgi:lysophospholipase L1-like esterase|nr:hypothetical protein [Solirubrobacteraceae bacterium]
MVRARLCPALVGCALAALCGATATSAVAADPGPYVALGDSYTAAPLVPTTHGEPLGCYRSTHNYPSLVAAGLGATTFTDVSCSSAETKDMTGAQTVQLGSPNPPQLSGLGATARLVTVGIGGNDAGLVGVATKCLQLGALAPTGSACRDYYAPNGNDTIAAKIDATAPKIASVLQAVHDRSPAARVAIVGYPDVAPPGGGAGCYPLVPVSPDDLRYIDALILRINAMIKTQAEANDAEYVDTYDDSRGHDVCTLPGMRWFEGLVPTMVAYPLHPNALGEASMARSVLGVLSGPRPAPQLAALKAVHRKIKRGRAAAVRFTINRAATVKLTLRRAKHGHYSRVLRTVTIDTARGANVAKLTSRSLRRPGRYRITATASSGTGEQVSAPRLTHVRVKRPR